MNKIENKKKEDILNKTKKIVSIEGWSSEIFSKLQKQNIKKNDLFYFFPEGYKGLLEYALQNINEKLEFKLKKINLINFPINKRIKKILLLRFDILNEDKEFYKKTFNHLLLPTNNKISKKSLYNSVNTMWYLAGDNSTDFNFYTKRLILSGTYTNALFVFFSKEMKYVEENIDKNLKRISKIPKIKERISFIKDNAPKFLKSFLA
ncbi:COQ9 family protein [Pelagibacteraceae bacterium]|nr:COQ9 family protein [Pelagibacteraceae bacterium]